MMSLRIFLVSLGLFGVIMGISNLMSNPTPVICSISDMENGNTDFSKYDYFKISGGRTIGYFFYSTDQATGRIAEIVYPIFSTAFIDSIKKVYESSQGYSKSNNNGLLEWITQNKIKPRVFVYSNIRPANVSALDSAIDTLDNKPVTGARMTKFIDAGTASTDISSEIKDKITENGYDMSDAIIIRENSDPPGDKTFGWWAILIGLILAGWFGYSLVKRVMAAYYPKSSKTQV